jgi:diguanylate cyclase (GGDEF)-like protein/PAS domain S-box-containing protein
VGGEATVDGSGMPWLGHLHAGEQVSDTGTWHMADWPDGEVVCSPKFCSLHGFAGAQRPFTLEAMLAAVHGDDRERLRDAMSAAFEAAEAYRLRYRIVRPDNTMRTVEAVGMPAVHESTRIVFGAVNDVTESERRVARLVAAESRFGAIVEHASEGILILNADGVITFVNRKTSEIMGRPLSEIVGQRPADFAEDAPADIATERRAHFEVRTRRGDGEPIWLSCALGPLPDDRGGGWVLIISDITARKRIEEDLRAAADSDALTGLMSRARLEKVLDRLLSEAHERSDSLALVFLDLDQFKYVNDSFGHSAGDALLREVGGLLPRGLRDGDMVARFAGDEFVIVLPRADEAVARRVAERLLTSVRDRRWQALSRISASAGIAVARPDRHTTREELLIAADVALREAKESGRDRMSVYTGRGGAAFAWIDEIRAALDEDRFTLFAQPILPVGSDRPTRYELLLRMRGTDGSIVMPSEFIPPAEQFGIIGELDRWVVRRAVELAAEGRVVEVNLSGPSLGDSQILTIVQQGIAAGLPPERLIFEVTETAAASNMDAARSFASALIALGCRFALDDFGTGFGSLTYLKHLPIDEVKIDIEFVTDLAVNEGDQRLVRAIIQMAEALGLNTVAEGVENEQTLVVLKDLGVDFVQGYHCGRPAPLELGALVQNESP